MQPAVYAHNVSPIPGTGQISPFFLVFGRNAPSPEVITLDVQEALMQNSLCLVCAKHKTCLTASKQI